MSGQRVAVFVDYENMIRTGGGLYAPPGAPRARLQLDPRILAERIVSYRNRPSTVVAVHVFRGQPDPEKDPDGAAANRLQAARWSRTGLVHLHTTPIRYPARFPAQSAYEQGVDELLARTLLDVVAGEEYDVAVIASHDQDLQSALSQAVNLRTTLLEVAAWDGARDRLRLHPGSPRPWCHRLTEGDYRTALESVR